ncbi:MAG: SDR family oxidoreductase [Candidatus Cyclobacteriaceae bacterium M3_2C_046]
MNDNPFKNKVAVVTGAGGTLCSAMARYLAQKGVKVALLGRTLEKLQVVEQQIKAGGGQAVALAGDVTDENRLQEIHKIVNEMLGSVDILINGAGGNQMEAITNINEFDEKELEGDPDIRGFFNVDMQAFRRVVDINTMGTVIPCQVFAQDMAKKKSGAIINIASMNSYRPLSRVAGYAMAKAGIENFTKWLAAYLAPANIRVNGIAPGFFLNERSRNRLTTEDGGYTPRGQSIIDHTPARRFGEADELIGTMHYLLDPEAAGFVTGITLSVDGGFMAQSGV